MTNAPSTHTRPRPVVAIDGPAGAGKSTVARMLAKRLGFVLIETGLLYRATAFVARENQIAWDDENGLEKLLGRIKFEYQPSAEPLGSAKLLIEGRDIADKLYEDTISMGASQVSRHPAVRHALLSIQQDLGKEGGVVMEGRDIGTVIFPDAECKFFITADISARTERRVSQMNLKAATSAAKTIEKNLALRDNQDASREIAPLRQAEDAHIIDTTMLTPEEVVDKLVAVISLYTPVT